MKRIIPLALIPLVLSSLVFLASVILLMEHYDKTQSNSNPQIAESDEWYKAWTARRDLYVETAAYSFLAILGSGAMAVFVVGAGPRPGSGLK